MCEIEVFTYENAKRWVKAGRAVMFWASEFPRTHPYSCYLIYKAYNSLTMRTPSTFIAIEDIGSNDCNGGA